MAGALAVLALAASAWGGPTTLPVVTKENFERAADYSAGLTGRTLLVMRGGKVLFERYDNGWSAGRPASLASGTKSFVGAVAAIAVDEGLVPSWDAKVSDALPEWRSDPLKSRVTVRELLSLSSGLEPGSNSIGGRLPSQPDDAYAHCLGLLMTGKPGEQFRYGPSHFYVFCAYLEARLKETGAEQTTFEAYFRAKLVEPMGMEIGRLGKDRAGRPNMPGGMMLTAREWAKFGDFVMLDGAVRTEDGEKRLVKAQTLAELFKRSKANPAYGLTWWLPGDGGGTDDADTGGRGEGTLADRQARNQRSQMKPLKTPDGKTLEVRMAAGLGKQRLIVIPELDLVIVRHAGITQQDVRKGAGYSDVTLVETLLGWK